MPLKDFLFTSESVSEGHPDKMCDQISDAVLDAHLAEDPNSRVALESLAKTGLIVLAGEITSKARPDYVKIARQTALEIGYNSPGSAAAPRTRSPQWPARGPSPRRPAGGCAPPARLSRTGRGPGTRTRRPG